MGYLTVSEWIPSRLLEVSPSRFGCPPPLPYAAANTNDNRKTQMSHAKGCAYGRRVALKGRRVPLPEYVGNECNPERREI